MSVTQKIEQWTADLDRVVDQNHARMVEVRRRLHAHPDLSGEEQPTSQYLYELLIDRGLRVEIGPEGRGVVAEPTENTTARVAVRADIDALRIHDQKTATYRSARDGIMHACGHDGHTATALGVILALQDLQSAGNLPWPVPWRAIFQPSEETATGAEEMIAAGAIEGIEAIFATHVDPTRQVGTIGVRPGTLTANCDAMRLTITGRGGHGARPHESNDPIAVAAQLISTLYLFVPRAADSQDAVVITFGQIIGGENANVIPESVELFGTLRTLERPVRQRAIEHIRQLARGIGEASGTNIEVEFERGVYSVDNDPALTDLVEQSARDVLGPEGVETIPRPSMGSEDFAAYLDHCPGTMFRLGCASETAGNSGLHTPTFDIDESALAIGAKILARSMVLWSQPAGSP